MAIAINHTKSAERVTCDDCGEFLPSDSPSQQLLWVIDHSEYHAKAG